MKYFTVEKNHSYFSSKVALYLSLTRAFKKINISGSFQKMQKLGPCLEDLVSPGRVGNDELPAGGEEGLAGLQPGQQLLHLHTTHTSQSATRYRSSDSVC
jgi:hypothetical protein